MDNLALPRSLAPRLRAALRSSPVVVVTGARQTGKSTLVRAVGGAERSYLTLDDIAVRFDAERTPEDLLRRAARLTLDEVQHHPPLLAAIKRAVDEHRTPGRFLLTGSANLLLLRRVAESLAGRAVYLTLWPMTRREQIGLGAAGAWGRLFREPASRWPDLLEAEDAPAADWRAYARHGGYPVPALRLSDHAERNDWFAGYAASYLERDVLQLSAVHSLVDLRRLMRAACLRLGTLVNQTELGRDVGLPQATVYRHLGLLEASYQLVRLPAYAVNRTKRLIKTPKLYWCDPGLAMHLAAETVPRGEHLENIVLADLLSWAAAESERTEVLYWRTAGGEEVDFVIERGQRLLAVEVKAATRVSGRDVAGLRSFRDEYGNSVVGGLLLYGGKETVRLAEGVVATPWWRVV